MRRHNNGDRSALLGLNGTAGWCVVNTEDAGRQLRLPEAMRRSEFCYSPRGWDQGDSDRYLPAVLHGCVPVMADRFEAMPLAELPEMAWDAAALAIERDDLPRLPALLDALPPARTREMRAAAAALWPRLLYTTLEFSTLEEIKRERDSARRARRTPSSASRTRSVFREADALPRGEIEVVLGSARRAGRRRTSARTARATRSRGSCRCSASASRAPAPLERVGAPRAAAVRQRDGGVSAPRRLRCARAECHPA